MLFRSGSKLFLKGDRCFKEKCAFERRGYPPGQHGRRRTKVQSYGFQLREKQKVKRYYGVLETQFRKYYGMAEQAKGNTGEVLMGLLERRLDNVIHRLGFGHSRAQARQIISHGHITINGRRLDVASYLVRPGDVIRVKNRPKSLEKVKNNLTELGREVPDFLTLVDGAVPEGHIVRMPEMDDVSIPVQAQLIVELCSK